MTMTMMMIEEKEKVCSKSKVFLRGLWFFFAKSSEWWKIHSRRNKIFSFHFTLELPHKQQQPIYAKINIIFIFSMEIFY
jgi:hypothetical protein